MASWRDVEESEPTFAAAVRAHLDARAHKTIATLRRDGSPRISGTESFISGGELWFGSMWRSRKALDLRRDPRFALHSGSQDPPGWSGDAKLSGRAIEADVATRERVGATLDEPPTGDWHLFRADIADVVLIGLDERREHMVIELWRPDHPLRRTERA